MGFLPSCTFCGTEVDPRKTGTYYKVRGWLEYRGAAGGGNNVEMKEMLGEYAHKFCMEEMKMKDKSVQESLF